MSSHPTKKRGQLVLDVESPPSQSSKRFKVDPRRRPVVERVEMEPTDNENTQCPTRSPSSSPTLVGSTSSGSSGTSSLRISRSDHPSQLSELHSDRTDEVLRELDRHTYNESSDISSLDTDSMSSDSSSEDDSTDLYSNASRIRRRIWQSLSPSSMTSSSGSSSTSSSLSLSTSDLSSVEDSLSLSDSESESNSSSPLGSKFSSSNSNRPSSYIASLLPHIPATSHQGPSTQLTTENLSELQSHLSTLQTRITTLLPILQAANQTLETERAAGKLAERDIENVKDEEDTYIEMNLGLGVLEEQPRAGGIRLPESKKPEDDSGSRASEAGSESGVNSPTSKKKGKKKEEEADILARMMGQRRARRPKPKIEVL